VRIATDGTPIDMRISRHKRIISGVMLVLVGICMIYTVVLMFTPFARRPADPMALLRPPASVADTMKGMESDDPFVRAMMLGHLRLMTHRFTDQDVVTFLNWICSPKYDPDENFAIVAQTARHGKRKVESQLVQRVIDVRSATNVGDGQCAQSLQRILESLDDRYAATIRENQDAATFSESLRNVLADRSRNW
jgi:hypothetical protein